jgi:hypothetical protein
MKMKLPDVLTAPFRWLNTVDPTPGFGAGKILRLVVKAVIFAFLAMLLQTVLILLRVPYVSTFWGQIVVLMIVYIPFFRWMNAEFLYRPTAPSSGAKAGAKLGKDGKKIKVKKVKYSGVKGKGPKF